MYLYTPREKQQSDPVDFWYHPSEAGRSSAAAADTAEHQEDVATPAGSGARPKETAAAALAPERTKKRARDRHQLEGVPSEGQIRAPPKMPSNWEEGAPTVREQRHWFGTTHGHGSKVQGGEVNKNATKK